MQTAKGRPLDEVMRESDERLEAAIKHYDEVVKTLVATSDEFKARHLMRAGRNLRDEVEKVLRGD